jgi:hypothetical protein
MCDTLLNISFFRAHNPFCQSLHQYSGPRVLLLLTLCNLVPSVSLGQELHNRPGISCAREALDSPSSKIWPKESAPRCTQEALESEGSTFGRGLYYFVFMLCVFLVYGSDPEGILRRFPRCCRTN